MAAGHPVATCEADAAAGAISASKPVTPPRSADEADAGAGEVKRPLKRARLGVIAPRWCLEHVGTGNGGFFGEMGRRRVDVKRFLNLWFDVK